MSHNDQKGDGSSQRKEIRGEGGGAIPSYLLS